MSHQIRRAQHSDLSAIGAIWNRVIMETTITFTTTPKDAKALLDWFEGRAAADQPVLVATDRGDVTGFASYGAFRSGEGYAHVAEHTIYLADRSMGTGLGRALLNRLEREAAQRGVAIFVAGISGANMRAIRFHDACGYTEVARMPDMGRKAGQSLELVLMQKHLEWAP